MATTATRNLIEIFLMSAGAICIAFLITPQIFNLIASAAQLPESWSRFRSWLRPPFLYLLVNCIILSIAAASRFYRHQTEIAISFHHSSSNYSEEFRHTHHRQHRPSDVDVHGSPLEPPRGVAGFNYFHDDAVSYYNDHGAAPEVIMSNQTTTFGTDEVEKAVLVEDGVLVKVANGDFVPDGVSDSKVASPLQRQGTVEVVTSFFKSQAEKPSPAVSSVHNCRPAIAAPQGAKPLEEGYETLETTWKRITEGRRVARHLEKSDTWRDHGCQIASSAPSVKKSETFKDRRSNFSPSKTSVKRETSLSQDELNQRVEAFIKKFNEDMRLQRQRSIQQLINPAA